MESLGYNGPVGIVAGLTSMLCWGSADFVAAILSRQIGSLRAVIWMTAFGDVAVVIYGLATGTLVKPTGSAFLLGVGAGLMHTIGTLSFYKGLSVGRVSLVAPISSGWSLILVVAAVLLYGEVLTSLQVVAIAVVIVGSFAVSTDLKEIRSSSKFALSDPGIAYAFVAMFSWGIGWLFFNEAVKQISWVVPNIVLASTILVLLTSYSLASKRPIALPPSGKLWLMSAFVGIGTIGAYISYSIGIERYLTSLVAPLAAAYPFVTVVLAVLLLRERTAPNQKLGVVAVIAGVVLLSTQ